MKTYIAALLLLAVPAFSCPIGCTEIDKNTCACEATPLGGDNTPSVKPSDEKVPTDKMPSYEREGIKADMPPSLTSADSKIDEAKQEAELAGKKAAGIN